jgi:glycosyltransferase involved in cell wall biosynthesis
MNDIISLLGDFMQKNDHNSTSEQWRKLLTGHEALPDDLCPPISIIIPTLNNAQKISITIESVLAQRYPDFEILVIDGGSTDRTLEIVKSFRNDKVRLCSISGSGRYEMLNKGITIAKGTYINFLFPGDFYIHVETLKAIMRLRHENDDLDLIYCGCLLREASKDVKILYRLLSLKLLKGGQQPTSLQSCWFKSSLFEELGKFDTNLRLRGGYDFLCRFMLHGSLSFCSTKRVLTDYDLRGVTKKMVIRHFYETGMIIFRHFGPATALKWLFRQNDTGRYFRHAWKGLKVALLGRD